MKTFTPEEYLKIDIANNYGLDKINWEHRLEWFEANKARLPSLLKEAKNPALFYAGYKALEAHQRGEAIGYPVSLDATSSGLQILSVLTGDREAAKLCNVLDTGHRKDAYTIIYEKMVEQVGGDKLDRNDVKRAIMTSFYGSEAVPKEVFGEGKLYKIFLATISKAAPYVWELNQNFLKWWDPNALKYSWVLPDNFHVHIKVEALAQETVEFFGVEHFVYRKVNQPVEEGRSLGANVTHSIDGFIVRELTRRCDYNPSQIIKLINLIFSHERRRYSKPENNIDNKMVNTLWDHYLNSGYLSARILDHLNEDNLHLVNPDTILGLIGTLPTKPFKIISIHDCFRVHPNYANDLRRQYNNQLYLIAKSNILNFILKQFVKEDINIEKVEDFSEEILETNYALS